jgi:hypothetical protein
MAGHLGQDASMQTNGAGRNSSKTRAAADVFDDPKFQAYCAHVKADLVPKLQGCEAAVHLVPVGDTDVKFAVELGFAIMLNKPIIAVLRPGATLPDKLRLVTDEIVHMPVHGDNASLADEVIAALTRIRDARQSPASS